MYDLVPWGSNLGSCIGSAKSSLDHQGCPLNTIILVYKSLLLSLLCFSGTKPPAHFFGQSHFVIVSFCLLFSDLIWGWSVTCQGFFKRQRYFLSRKEKEFEWSPPNHTVSACCWDTKALVPCFVANSRGGWRMRNPALVVTSLCGREGPLILLFRSLWSV